MVYTLMQTMILFDPGTKHFLHIWFCGFKLEDVYIITMTLHSILSLRQIFCDATFLSSQCQNVIFYQDKDVEKINKVSIKEFLSLCGWFIDNKPSFLFGDDEAKTIFFCRKKSLLKLNIYGDCSLKQHNTVEYFKCYLG